MSYQMSYQTWDDPTCHRPCPPLPTHPHPTHILQCLDITVLDVTLYICLLYSPHPCTLHTPPTPQPLSHPSQPYPYPPMFRHNICFDVTLYNINLPYPPHPFTLNTPPTLHTLSHPSPPFPPTHIPPMSRHNTFLMLHCIMSIYPSHATHLHPSPPYIIPKCLDVTCFGCYVA